MPVASLLHGGFGTCLEIHHPQIIEIGCGGPSKSHHESLAEENGRGGVPGWCRETSDLCKLDFFAKGDSEDIGGARSISCYE